MSRSGHEDHVLVVFLDQPVQVNVDERQAGARSPVSEQTVLDVLGLERLLQQRVVDEIDHPQCEVIAGSPVGVGFAEFFRLSGDPEIVDRACPYALSEVVDGAWASATGVILAPFFPAVAVE